jgi:hypothetical protein
MLKLFELFFPMAIGLPPYIVARQTAMGNDRSKFKPLKSFKDLKSTHSDEV